MNDLFPETINKAVHGTVWWRGRRQCRNFHGFFQSRDDGVGLWQFSVPWFSADNLTCTVYAISSSGELEHCRNIPIDRRDRLTIMGRQYGREAWRH
ncbi:hypothetical protein SDC9_38226 [bioreactor metagenome]|uniref:Uncharacterized protein n=1 Tax=bioreactor metagenome TaxID=1076179 RepID=A0A644VL47_9ZZZZ